MLASGNSALRAVVARNARIHRYGWREVSLARTMVRASVSDGAERTRRMARQRIRFHVLRCRGLPRLSALGTFILMWVIVTTAACLSAGGPWRIGLTPAPRHHSRSDQRMPEALGAWHCPTIELTQLR